MKQTQAREPIRVNSDSWTGRDPAREGNFAPTPRVHRFMRRFALGLMAFSLVHLGYVLGVMDEWTDLILPLNTLMMAVVAYKLPVWNKHSKVGEG